MKNTIIFLITTCAFLPLIGMIQDRGNDFEALLTEAKTHVLEGDMSKASAVLEWISLKDTDQERKAVAYYGLGNIWQQKDNDLMAKFFFKSALALEQNANEITIALSRLDLGLLYASQNKLSKARKLLRAAASSHDQSVKNQATEWLKIDLLLMLADSTDMEQEPLSKKAKSKKGTTYALFAP
jgi:tetratricopeptide (TPR) repeat protein